MAKTKNTAASTDLLGNGNYVDYTDQKKDAAANPQRVKPMIRLGPLVKRGSNSRGNDKARRKPEEY